MLSSFSLSGPVSYFLVRSAKTVSRLVKYSQLSRLVKEKIDVDNTQNINQNSLKQPRVFMLVFTVFHSSPQLLM